ncbi:hypothetical protein JQ299_02460 [Helicobacter pylori]|uniref:hypothetical protein n=1 Tax=Helicobacter pylori TaxID=210 RepID=UPI000BEC2D27|nr:hypothetical protein [Helicobacter pylori]MBM0629059.1 hypothetical protein [Helicobacter pylori]PDW33248.1 hypothetical protein BB453_04430 [Helicobacter pylori]PDW40600.1 hypothetical protein BB424_02845 [Helicobacter pylori]PDW51764.1 hypothetical protein BB435_06865 [Helicobacter pylori]PDW63058.1 hypothetical protein BB445_02865 [Helicobacter pylori]
MIVFCKAILGLLRGNDFKTLPIPYEVYYQTKSKKQVFKSERMAKKLKTKTGESLRVKLQTL